MKNDINEARAKAYSLMQELIDVADFDEFLKGTGQGEGRSDKKTIDRKRVHLISLIR